MRLLIFLSFVLLFACTTTKQVAEGTTSVSNEPTKPVDVSVSQADVARDISYLASDELGGRGTGSAGIEMASNYISEVFAEAKIPHIPGKNRYDQTVPLVEEDAPVAATLSVADKTFVLKDDLLVLHQAALDNSAALKFLGDASLEDIKAMDLGGAIVVTIAGSKSESDPRAFYQLALEKQKLVGKAGGVALIELYRSPRAPFSQVYRFFGGSGLKIAYGQREGIPLLWLNDPKGQHMQVMDEAAGTSAKLSLIPGKRTVVPANNLVGFVPGTDPKFNKEAVIITAHYDHLGIDGSRGGVDSIFNGARDNAMGTAALLGVARHFGTHPGKRPVILLAVTAEERGLLGSEFYVEKPWFPLNNVVFNLNLDGAGYDDTSSVTINGYGRTTWQEAIDLSIAEKGILPNPDPIPEMNLFQFSDNWSFAKRGVPAINLAPGFTGFSEELMKYYHQAGDHADQLDFAYVTRYVEAAVAAAQAVANLPTRPAWVEGDALVPVAKELYSN